MDPKTTAAGILKNAAYDSKKLAAIHTGASLLLSLVLTVANFYLTRAIDSTVGLSQMGSRAILGTVQSVLSFLGPLLLPFWEAGFFAAVLRNVRHGDAVPGDLLSGFRKGGAVARLYLLQFGIYLVLAFVCVQIASTLFSLTPHGMDAMTAIEDILLQAQAAGQTVLSDQDVATILPILMPVYAAAMILLVLLAVPAFYLLRMSFFALFDDAKGAFDAVKISFRMMFKCGFRVFLLDLRFWWYYLAQLIITAVAYLDLILPALGVQLPLPEDGFFFATYAAHIVLQLLLAWQFASWVQTSYGVFYDSWKSSLPKKEPLPQIQNEFL